MVARAGFPLVGFLLAGCTGEPAPDSGDASDTPVVHADPSGAVVLTDESNYRLASTLDAPSFPLRGGGDVTIDWSGCDTDIQCQALDPVGDIDNVSVFVFPNLTEEEVEQRLVDDTLVQTDMGGFSSLEPGDATEASLSQLTFFGTDSDIETYFVSGSGTWLAVLSTGTEIGRGTRMLAFLEPTDGETADRATLDPGCGTLQLDVDLHSAEAVPALADGPWHLDWSGLTMDGRGHPLVLSDVDEVVVAGFADTDVAGLEGDFFDLESLADEWYSLPIDAGSDADLSAAGVTRLDPDLLWLVGLRCGLCSNPAPLALARLAPE